MNQTSEQKIHRYSGQPDEVKGLRGISKLWRELFWSFDQTLSFLAQNHAVLFYAEEQGVWQTAILYTQVCDEADLVFIFTIPQKRKQGQTLSTFQETMTRLELEKNVKKISLEVRQSNVSAIRLYEKCGFKKCGVRLSYYSDGEDAEFYVRNLSADEPS